MGNWTIAQIITEFFKSDICTWYQILDATEEDLLLKKYGRLKDVNEKYKFYDCQKIEVDNGMIKFYIYI